MNKSEGKCATTKHADSKLTRQLIDPRKGPVHGATNPIHTPFIVRVELSNRGGVVVLRRKRLEVKQDVHFKVDWLKNRGQEILQVGRAHT